MNSRRCRSGGFTLIEVVIAITLLGVSYAAVLNAFSGSLRLLRQATEYQNAMLLARSKLDEMRLDTSMDIVDQENEENYGGVVYSYKIEVRPLSLQEEAQQENFPAENLQAAEKTPLPVKLESINVAVFWGKTGQEKHYQLTSWKIRPTEAPAQPAPASAQPQAGAAPGTPATGQAPALSRGKLP
jgi:prepilin-type N-terminal cleavage/methylation domain-containing protein